MRIERKQGMGFDFNRIINVSLIGYASVNRKACQQNRVITAQPVNNYEHPLYKLFTVLAISTAPSFAQESDLSFYHKT